MDGKRAANDRGFAEGPWVCECVCVCRFVVSEQLWPPPAATATVAPHNPNHHRRRSAFNVVQMGFESSAVATSPFSADVRCLPDVCGRLQPPPVCEYFLAQQTTHGQTTTSTSAAAGGDGACSYRCNVHAVALHSRTPLRRLGDKHARSHRWHASANMGLNLAVRAPCACDERNRTRPAAAAAAAKLD